MFKKALFVGAGLLLVAAVVFGGRLVPYAQTAYESVTTAVNDSVPIEFQIKAARKQLDKIEPEIYKITHKVAQEKADIRGLERELENQDTVLAQKYKEMMTLRGHLESGDSVYVTTSGRAYSNERVEKDLRNRLSIYQKAEQNREIANEVLDIRQGVLETAVTKLNDAKALQNQLEIQLENLSARERMVDVTKRASSFKIVGTSQLSRAQSMLDEISAHLDAEEEMVKMVGHGEIPVEEEVFTGDILDEMTTYFSNKIDESEVVTK